MNQKPLIIAEMCQNHNGDTEILKRMIHTAAENGADFAKSQLIRSQELTHRPRFDEGQTNSDGTVQTIKRPYKDEYERLKKLDLSRESEQRFVNECRRAGIAPMTTAFTYTGLFDARDMGFEALKLASYDCSSFPFIEKAKQYFSTIVASTGATYDHEIKLAAQILQDVNFYLLHCVTIYPTPLNEMHLNRLAFLRRFTNQVGFSDHSKPAETDLKACKAALALGATCIERHYTVLGPKDSKDGPVSITPQHLKELRQFADMTRQERMEHLQKEYPEWENEAMGQTRRELSAQELLNRDYYQGRFAAPYQGQWIFNWQEWPE